MVLPEVRTDELGPTHPFLADHDAQQTNRDQVGQGGCHRPPGHLGLPGTGCPTECEDGGDARLPDEEEREAVDHYGKRPGKRSLADPHVPGKAGSLLHRLHHPFITVFGSSIFSKSERSSCRNVYADPFR